MSKIFQEDPWEGNTVLDSRKKKARFCFLLSNESAEVGLSGVFGALGKVAVYLLCFTPSPGLFLVPSIFSGFCAAKV